MIGLARGNALDVMEDLTQQMVATVSSSESHTFASVFGEGGKQVDECLHDLLSACAKQAGVSSAESMAPFVETLCNDPLDAENIFHTDYLCPPGEGEELPEVSTTSSYPPDPADPGIHR